MMENPLDRLLRTVQFAAGALFLILFLVNILRIFLRNIAGITWFWIPGFSSLVFIWTVFLGATSLYATDDHLIMDYFLSKMRPGARRRLSLIIHSVFLVFLVVLIVYGFKVLTLRMRIPYTSWNFPTGYAYLAAPVCGILMLFFCLRKLWDLGRRSNPEAPR